MTTFVFLALLSAALQIAFGGGTGLNVVVVVNRESPQSLELGNFYCEHRQVPPDNLLRISWTGGNTLWSSNDFYTRLQAPLLDMLARRSLANQIDYVVLSMDIPFQTATADSINSTTSALFYGLKEHNGVSWRGVTNSYAGSENVFRHSKPASASGPSFLATMITARTLDAAKRLVLQGVAGDSSLPHQSVVLAKTSDPLRNFRYYAFDDAIFNTRLCHGSIIRTNTDSVLGQTNLLGYQTGLINLDLSSGTFVPGAIADSLTSFGGIIFGPNDHTSLLAFIEAGASGSYGTVAEPGPTPDKFPDPRDYFYQARGFNLAEAYYLSIADPHEGLIVGEPLSAPYARPAAGRWTAPASNSVLSGIVPLQMAFTAASADRPLSRVDLFLDGKFLTTVTNLPPAPGNETTLNLNGYPVQYTVPVGASLASVARGLALAVNTAAASQNLQVRASSTGDRIQLHSTATNGAPFFFIGQPRPQLTPQFYRAEYLPEVEPTLNTVGRTDDGGFALRLASPAGMECTIEASTDLKSWVPVLTNASGGLTEFVDNDATQYPNRFYRLAWQRVEIRPRLTLLSPPTPAGLDLRIETTTNLPYTVEASTDLTSWFPLHTNLSGGSMTLHDSAAIPLSTRFYRTFTPKSYPPLPITTQVALTPVGSPIIRIDNAVRPYVILSSTNLMQWSPIFTNLSPGSPTLTASSAKGESGSLFTFLSVSAGGFSKSTAYGIQPCSVSGSLQPGTWLRAVVSLTNGTSIAVGVTNTSTESKAIALVQKLLEAINAAPALAGPDGLVAEDIVEGWFGSASFNLRARSPGPEAAGLSVRFEAALSLGCSPGPSAFQLQQNLADLQPRAHVMVRSGQALLRSGFLWDTRRIPDGSHELAAVAYEGSHVEAQTKLPLSVEIRNTELGAELSLPGPSDLRSVSLPVSVQVTANTSEVATIQLFSTGGLQGTFTNQSAATFTISGEQLGAGLHPFFALVESTTGQRYRTPTRYLRLTNP